MNTRDLPIAIAGAGIGGLAAALTLAANGHPVALLDKAPALREVGAGIQLSPNACAVLDRLGLMEALRPLACAPEALGIWSGKTGRRLATVRMGQFLEDRHGFPFWQVHRADLQNVLLNKVRATSGIELRLGCDVTDLSATAYDSLACIFRQGDGSSDSLRCRALIGADGVWSKVRRLVPGHANASFSGQVAYRATVPVGAAPARWSAEPGLWLHRDCHLVHYPVRGGRDLNVVALVREDWQDETWSAEASRDTLLRRLGSWPAEVRNLIGCAESWLKWALCSVDAQAPWTHGHVALMGDAAHAMLPFMAQGAGMALEDAAVLAAHLPRDVANIPAALRAFELERKARAARVQAISFGNARVYHLAGPAAFARDTVLRLSGPERLAARFDDIYGWKPDA